MCMVSCCGFEVPLMMVNCSAEIWEGKCCGKKAGRY